MNKNEKIVTQSTPEIQVRLQEQARFARLSPVQQDAELADALGRVRERK